MEHHRPQALHNKAVHWVRVDTKNCSEVESLARIYTLHHGEKQALSVCVSHELPRLLSDDTTARLAAKALNIQSYVSVKICLVLVRVLLWYNFYTYV